MKRRRLTLLAAASFVAIALACSSSTTPGTPAAPTSSTASSGIAKDANSAPDGSTLKVTAPVAVSPANEVKLTEQNPTLTAQGST